LKNRNSHILTLYVEKPAQAEPLETAPEFVTCRTESNDEQGQDNNITWA
jgi:hypothetical protein